MTHSRSGKTIDDLRYMIFSTRITALANWSSSRSLKIIQNQRHALFFSKTILLLDCFSPSNDGEDIREKQNCLKARKNYQIV